MLKFIGTGLTAGDHYHRYERNSWASVSTQIEQHFPNQRNLLISLTWFGPQFINVNEAWLDLLEFETNKEVFDNVFFLATVDPPYLNVSELQEVKNKVQALRVFYLGNFDGAHGFNFFAPILLENFKQYSNNELLLEQVEHTFINYNRKPKPHRVEFVKKLINFNLLEHGIVTLGRDETNNLHLTLNECQEDYIGVQQMDFDLPSDYYTLHRMDLWKTSFLYINGATEFDPNNDLFCQQDTFKPILGLRPMVINGVQRTYRWLRLNGFKTFNDYWSHIDIEQGDVHDTLIELIQFLTSQPKSELLAMYNDMLPSLEYNKQRFFEFAIEQKYKMDHLF